MLCGLVSTANDYPRDFEVSGYPSLFLVPAKKGAKPIKYDGDREVDAMAKFVHKKAKYTRAPTADCFLFVNMCV
jgi:hypothetical protein